jgi:hypothetical protein
MENGPFIDDFPIKPPICKGFSMAMLNNQMVYPLKNESQKAMSSPADSGTSPWWYPKLCSEAQRSLP